MDRSKDWMAQAERNLEQARWSLDAKFYELTCFLSQQAAEMAIKALCEYKKVEYWGHSCSKILRNLSSIINVPEDLIEKVKILDRHYIPTRYPNSFESGAPKDYYTQKDGKEAITFAEEILSFCKEHLQR